MKDDEKKLEQKIVREVRMALSTQAFYRDVDDLLKKGGTGSDVANLISKTIDDMFSR